MFSRIFLFLLLSVLLAVLAKTNARVDDKVSVTKACGPLAFGRLCLSPAGAIRAESSFCKQCVMNHIVETRSDESCVEIECAERCLSDDKKWNESDCFQCLAMHCTSLIRSFEGSQRRSIRKEVILDRPAPNRHFNFDLPAMLAISLKTSQLPCVLRKCPMCTSKILSKACAACLKRNCSNGIGLALESDSATSEAMTTMVDRDTNAKLASPIIKALPMPKSVQAMSTTQLPCMMRKCQICTSNIRSANCVACLKRNCANGIGLALESDSATSEAMTTMVDLDTNAKLASPIIKALPMPKSVQAMSTTQLPCMMRKCQICTWNIRSANCVACLKRNCANGIGSLVVGLRTYGGQMKVLANPQPVENLSSLSCMTTHCPFCRVHIDSGLCKQCLHKYCHPKHRGNATLETVEHDESRCLRRFCTECLQNAKSQRCRDCKAKNCKIIHEKSQVALVPYESLPKEFDAGSRRCLQRFCNECLSNRSSEPCRKCLATRCVGNNDITATAILSVAGFTPKDLPTCPAKSFAIDDEARPLFKVPLALAYLP